LRHAHLTLKLAGERLAAVERTAVLASMMAANRVKRSASGPLPPAAGLAMPDGEHTVAVRVRGADPGPATHRREGGQAKRGPRVGRGLTRRRSACDSFPCRLDLVR
jgi:hypothetical protein